MNKRAQIKKEHERAVMLDFLNWYNLKEECSYVIYAEPDPPEALIKDGNKLSWLEVTDTFYSNEWAKTITSNATPGEKNHKWQGGLQVNMDVYFAKKFVENLQKKLTKNSYVQPAKEFGAGILLITLEYPFLSNETFEEIIKCCELTDWSGDLLCFKNVYIVYPRENKKVFSELKYA